MTDRVNPIDSLADSLLSKGTVNIDIEIKTREEAMAVIDWMYGKSEAAEYTEKYGHLPAISTIYIHQTAGIPDALTQPLAQLLAIAASDSAAMDFARKHAPNL